MKSRCIYLLAALALVPLGAQAQPPKIPGAAQDVSKKDPAQATPEQREFRFNGGYFRDFTNKLAQEFGSNVIAVLDVHGEERAFRFRIPKMRYEYDARDTATNRNWSQALSLYNSISEKGDNFLGKWIWRPFPALMVDGRNPSPNTLIFVPPKSAAAEAGGVQVRAFPVLELGEEKLKKLVEVIEKESNRIQSEVARGEFAAGQDVSLVEGRISVHEGSGLLVAAGGKTYVDLVASVVEAFKKNYPSLRELAK